MFPEPKSAEEMFPFMPPNKSVESVVISKKEYNKLKKDSKFLDCLMELGVDNWDGWSDAWKLFNEE